MDIDSEIIRFRNDWEIDFPNKVIKRKKVSFIRRAFEKIWKQKYPVIALYRFAQYHLSTSEGIVWPNFFKRSKGNEIANVPSWFQISEEWNIPSQDIKYLFLGSLICGENILVPALPRNGLFLSLWQLLGILATLGGAIGFILMVFNLFAG